MLHSSNNGPKKGKETREKREEIERIRDICINFQDNSLNTVMTKYLFLFIYIKLKTNFTVLSTVYFFVPIDFTANFKIATGFFLLLLTVSALKFQPNHAFATLLFFSKQCAVANEENDAVWVKRPSPPCLS